MRDGEEEKRPGLSGTEASAAETIRLLRTLAAQVRDSEAGYRHAYEETQDETLRVELGRLVEEREDMIEALDDALTGLGQTPDTGGTVLGAAHRLFVGLRAAIRGHDQQAILKEIVRGESVLEESYDAAIKAGLPPAVHNVVRRQHRLARRSRDRFRAMIANGSEAEASIGGLTLSSAVAAVQRHPTLSATMLAALAVGFAGALWATRYPGRHR